MRIIISPAKQIRVDTDTFNCTAVPVFMEKTGILKIESAAFEGRMVVQKGGYSKMARGGMVRYLAGIHADGQEQIKAFNWSDYHFDESRSFDTVFFIRKEIHGKRL